MAPKQGSPGLARPQLRLSHVRSVFTLLCEVRELGASPVAWRRHMVSELRRLVDADTCVATEAVIPKRAGSFRLFGMVIGGVIESRLVSIYRALIERGGYPLDSLQGSSADRVNVTCTRTRQQMAGSRAWRQHPDVDPWRVLDCEYFICSNHYLPTKRLLHLLVLTRSRRRGPFGELERRVVALFHAELARMWRRVGDQSGADLSPQLQQTLELLLEGLSEGEIVSKLGLSPHTVHDHVKRLYRHFQVNSRAQLLARLSRSLLVRAPRLCVDMLSGEDDRRFDSVELADVGSGGKPPVADSFGVRSRTAKG